MINILNLEELIKRISIIYPPQFSVNWEKVHAIPFAFIRAVPCDLSADWAALSEG